MPVSLRKQGPVRDLNPGPLAPKARIIPLDQRALLTQDTLMAKLTLPGLDHAFVKTVSRASRENRTLDPQLTARALRDWCSDH